MIEPVAGDIFDGRYEILSVLGAGGIGTVFKARQIDIDRVIALKVLHPHVVVDEEFKIRFVREAQALNKLAHSNIVAIYHLGIADGAIPYLAMEFIEGKSLRAEINNSNDRMSTERALKIIRDAANALAFVHEHGIIHRDLKPDNIILVDKPEKDTVKLIDFGLAKYSDDKDQKLTGTGALIGTVAYMSPEQCAGKRADMRSDIYSLCLCLYEILTGEAPFTADTPIGVMYKHLNSEAPEIKARDVEKFRPSLNGLMQKGLAKDPDTRYQNMSDLSASIDEVIDQLEGGKSVARAGMKGIAGTTALICLGVLILSAAVYFMRIQSKNNAPLQRSAASTKKLQRFTENVIASEMYRGNRMKAREMCESTLSFQNLSAVQRARLLVQLGELTYGFETFNCQMQAILILQKYPGAMGEKLFSQMMMSDTLQRLRLPMQAIRSYEIAMINVKSNGIPFQEKNIYTFRLNQRDHLYAGAIACLIDVSENAKALNYLQEVKQYLDPDDENEVYGALCVEALRLQDFKYVKGLIDSSNQSNPLVDMSDSCLRYQKQDLAALCIKRAKAAEHGFDGHTFSREILLLLAQSRYFLDQGKTDIAQELLKRQVEILRKTSKNERATVIHSMLPLMGLAGLPIDEALEICGMPAQNSAILPSGKAWSYSTVTKKHAEIDKADGPLRDKLQTEQSRQIHQLLKTQKLTAEQKSFLYWMLYTCDSTNPLAALHSGMEVMKTANLATIPRDLRLSLLSYHGKALLQQGISTQAQKEFEAVYEDVKTNGLTDGPANGYYKQALTGLLEIYYMCNKMELVRSLINEPTLLNSASNDTFTTCLKLNRSDLARTIIQSNTSITDIWNFVGLGLKFHREKPIKDGIDRAKVLALTEPDITLQNFKQAKTQLYEIWFHLEFGRKAEALAKLVELNKLDFSKLPNDCEKPIKDEIAACYYALGSARAAKHLLPVYFSSEAWN